MNIDAVEPRPVSAMVLAALFIPAMDGFNPGAFADTPLNIVNVLNSPIRITEGNDSRLYVSDSKANSIFILKNLLTEAELKEFYDAGGNKIRDIGVGTVQMPNDLALDQVGNLNVAESLANNIQVYAPDGTC